MNDAIILKRQFWNIQTAHHHGERWYKERSLKKWNFNGKSSSFETRWFLNYPLLNAKEFTRSCWKRNHVCSIPLKFYVNCFATQLPMQIPFRAENCVEIFTIRAKLFSVSLTQWKYPSANSKVNFCHFLSLQHDEIVQWKNDKIVTRQS